jgi:23S rRNA maturation-related 3'-5' exoribonuclease YhaM
MEKLFKIRRSVMSQEVFEFKKDPILDQGLLMILHLLMESKSGGGMGVTEEKMITELNLERSEVLKDLDVLSEKGIAFDKILQTGTGGTSDRFWRLAEGVLVKCVISKAPSSE